MIRQEGGEPTSDSMHPIVIGIVMGSQSDWTTMRQAADILDELGIGYEVRIVSAHRTPKRMADYAETARGRIAATIERCLGLILGTTAATAAASGASHASMSRANASNVNSSADRASATIAVASAFTRCECRRHFPIRCSLKADKFASASASMS